MTCLVDLKPVRWECADCRAPLPIPEDGAEFVECESCHSVFRFERQETQASFIPYIPYPAYEPYRYQPWDTYRDNTYDSNTSGSNTYGSDSNTGMMKIGSTYRGIPVSQLSDEMHNEMNVHLANNPSYMLKWSLAGDLSIR